VGIDELPLVLPELELLEHAAVEPRVSAPIAATMMARLNIVFLPVDVLR